MQLAILPSWLKPGKAAPLAPPWMPFREGLYRVSKLGDVCRVAPGIATFAGRPLRWSCGATGYAQVTLSVTGEKPVRLYVHRIVAEAFLGTCPEGHVVNHRDGNKLNNELENLEYVTRKENARHALATLPRYRGPVKPKKPLVGPQVGDRHWARRKPERIARGERAGSSRLTDSQVRTIKTRLASGEMQKTLAGEFGVSVAQMSRIARGMQWAHIHAEEQK